MAILNVYKPIGWTPLQCIDRIREILHEYKNSPITYAGRLDPMAEGVLILLTDEDRYHKDEYQKLDKIYEATILLGIETDSLDTLGMPTQTSIKTGALKQNNIRQFLLGTHELPFPNYSSYKVQGKPLHWWTQNNRLTEITIPSKKMGVHKVNNIRIQEISTTDVINHITKNIQRVTGDFRQEEILQAWSQTLHQPQAFTTISLTLSVTSGTYIRSLAHELGKHLGTNACLLSLKRTVVGTHKESSSLNLI